MNSDLSSSLVALARLLAALIAVILIGATLWFLENYLDYEFQLAWLLLVVGVGIVIGGAAAKPLMDVLVRYQQGSISPPDDEGDV